ncbi:transcriptional regulator, TetR family [Jatrophihabitans endophyticus]|uniref:Transcriptional regulator, TetR family n=1 Tax=Jatrophihabitans endophyticus TaxID=1206085 RepID=A0A1M5MTT8_9ACTN|nr:TetR family transcriptional regulator [Jatrophihabitans endophyticus]SHG80542.1 transcriptional regulator, TetR family [Jatrophihabitans endophyticus]
MTVPYPTAARALLRDTVLAAVDDLARRRGWAATTMADVAKAAGVSRQTLYNEFGSRPALVEAYVAREIETLVDAVGTAVRAHADDAHVALRNAFALFLELASDEPVVRIIVAESGSAEDGELTRLLTGLGQRLAGERIAVLIPEVWPQVGPVDARLVADSLVRMAISHALVPVDDPAVVASGVGRMLAPFVDQVLDG